TYPVFHAGGLYSRPLVVRLWRASRANKIPAFQNSGGKKKQNSINIALPLICALNRFAQNKKSETAKKLIEQWEIATDQLIRVAEAMPAEKYDYKPVKEVGAFGDQLKHAGIAMRILLANAEGKKVEIKDSMLDKLKTKEEIIAELRKIAGEGA